MNVKVDGEGFVPVFSQGPPFDVGALKGERAGLEKEIPEKIRKTVSRRNGIIVLLRGTSTWEGGGEGGKALDCSSARVA